MPAQDWLDNPELPHRLAEAMRPDEPHSMLFAAHRVIAFLRDNRSALQQAVGVIEAPPEMAALAAEAMRARDVVNRIRGLRDFYTDGIFPPVDLGECRARLGDSHYTRLHGSWARHLLDVVLRMVDEGMREDADTPADASPGRLGAGTADADGPD